MGHSGTLWDAIGLPVGGLLAPFGSLWSSLAPFGVRLVPFWPLGSRDPLWPLSRESLKKTVKSGSQSRFLIDVCSGIVGLEQITGIRQIWQLRTNPDKSGNTVASTTARDLPSTRAWGQDDVSSTQTPSNNIIQHIYIYIYIYTLFSVVSHLASLSSHCVVNLFSISSQQLRRDII